MPLKTLIEFGLSEKEAKTYLALLELEVAGVNEIAKKSGVNRSSTYVVIEALKKKGLVSTSPDKNVLQFVPASPETILQAARENKEKAATIEKKIEHMLPELKATKKTTKRMPKVIVYEGTDAQHMSHNFSFGPEFRIFKDLTGYLGVHPPNRIEQSVSRRVKEKVKMFLIAPDTEENRVVVEKHKKLGSSDEFLLIPPERFAKVGSKNIGVGIYKDRVKFASTYGETKDKFAIYIINQEITDTLRDLFDLAWHQSKRFGASGRGGSRHGG